MPYAKEVAGLRVAHAGCAKESESCAIVISGHHFSELGVLNAERSSSILRFRPVLAAIMRDRDFGMAVRIYIPEINRIVLARRNRWIAAGAESGAIRNG